MNEQSQFQKNSLLPQSSAAIQTGILQRKCAACGTHTIAGNKCDECKKGTLQRKSSDNSEHSEVPPIVHEVLRSSGQPLDTATRAFMEPRFGHDFSHVRVHTDTKAGESAQSVDALAYTVGHNMVFRAGQYAPHSSSGRRLLAHELAHTLQQNQQSAVASSRLTVGSPHDYSEKEADHKADTVLTPQGSDTSGSKSTRLTAQPQHAPVKLMRVPAAPKSESGDADFDRSKVQIGDISDVVINRSSTPAVPSQTVTISISHPDVAHLYWTLYDPNDGVVAGIPTSTDDKDATSRPFTLAEKYFPTSAVQGRYLLRCIGRNKKHKPVVYADKTFFVWTSTPIAEKSLTDLKKIKNTPDKHSLGEVGAAQARSMMLEHKEAVAATGTGTVQGNQCSAPTAGVGKSDCTNYVLDVLKFAFTAKGKSADWDTVFKEAQKTSAGKFKGNELVKALISKAGWKAVFWAPDPRNPADQTSEHPAAYKRVREQGEYRSANETTGIPVDASKSVIDYRKTSPTKKEDMTGIDKLHKIPLAVITARGGKHMTLLLSGQVYEVHWDKPATDPDVIEATRLEKWVWESGAVVMPGEDYAKAF